MSEQLTLGYEALKSVFLDAAEEVQSAVNKKFGTPVSLAAGSDRVVAQRQAAQAAGDIASREAGVGAVEGMRARPTDVDFRAPTERARTVADAARPTTAGGISPAEARRTVPGEKLLDAPSGPRDPALRITEADAGVSQRFQAGRTTAAGEPLQRARQAARIADPEFARSTEPFTPGTQQARLNEVRPTTAGRASVSGMPTERIPGSQIPTQPGRAASSLKASDLADDIMKIKNQATRTRFFADVIPESEIMEALTALEQMAPDEVVRLGTDKAPNAVNRLMTRLASDPKTAETFVKVAPKLASAAKALRVLGPIGSAVGTGLDIYQMGSEFAATQDPVEQLRFVYEQQGSQPLKIGRGGLSQKAMEDLVEKNPNAVSIAIDQGILDPSVGEMLRGATEKTKQKAAPAAAKSRTELETIPITADAPKTAPARGSNLLAMGSRGAGVQKIQEDLTALNQFENILSGKMAGARGPFDPGVSGADGVFGQDTQAAVKAFQKSAGITEDGIVGPETRDALKKALDASKSAVKLQRSQAEEIKSMPSPAEPPTFGAGLQRVDEGPLEAAASEFEDITEIEPVKSDRDAPIQNTQAYEDLELDEKPRRTAFPMARDFRRRRNRR